MTTLAEVQVPDELSSAEREVLAELLRRVGREGGRPRKLTDEERVEVRRLRAEGVPVDELVEAYQVSRATIYRA